MAEPQPPTPPATDFTVDELMVTVMAAWLDDHDQIVNGMASPLAVCAIELARRTHAPHLTWIASGIGCDPRFTALPESTLAGQLWMDSAGYLDHHQDFWHLVQSRRRLRKFFVGAAQLDQYGNANNSVLGADFHAPQRRLPGTAGLADMAALGKELYHWVPQHTPRTLVERVDFISAPGYLTGYGARARAGLAAGPAQVVSDLAVMDFEPGTQRMRLKSTHPGVTVETVQSSTGFELVLPPGGVGTTPPPSAHHVRLLRESIDPSGLRRRGVGPSRSAKRSSDR